MHKLKSLGKSSAIIGILSVLIFDLLEEVLEVAFAYFLSWTFTAILSAVFSVIITKSARRLLTKTIKLITYKRGTDKMEKVKKIANWLYANKKSLLATIANALATGGSTALVWTADGLPQILVNGFNIAPIIYTIAVVVIGVFNELGICGKGFEQVKVFFERINAAKQAKAIEAANKKAEAEAQRLLKEQQEAEAKLEAEALEAIAAEEAAKAQRKAEEEHKKLVEAKMLELKARAANN